MKLLGSRHEFYETDERLTLSIFDKGADPEKVSIVFEPRKVSALHSSCLPPSHPLSKPNDPRHELQTDD